MTGATATGAGSSGRGIDGGSASSIGGGAGRDAFFG